MLLFPGFTASLVVFVMAIAYDHVLSPEEEASFNVDALVNDSVFEPQGIITSMAGQFVQPNRRATPSVPPGFAGSNEAKTGTEGPPALSSSRNAPHIITPAVPAVPIPAVQPLTATPTKTKGGKQNEVIGSTGVEHTEKSGPATMPPTTPAKSSRRASTKSQASAVTPKGKPSEIQFSEQKENKPGPSMSPAKGTPKARAGKKGQNVVEPSSQKEAKNNDITTAPGSSKRQHPGKLDIAAATKSSEGEESLLANSTKPEGQSKHARAMSAAVTPSVPGSPAAIATGSPVKKSASTKTLRVVATPKTETPPLSANSLPSLPQVPNVEKLRSRQASVASLNQPGTPAGELVSDTASITSTSISRANSPPPVGSKVGTAPVRKKTKSQQKKDRQERARQAEEERTLAMEDQKSEPEVVQAPIIGRKKKAKKPSSIPIKPYPLAKSQVASPKPARLEDEQEQPVSVPTSSAASKRPQPVKASTPSPRADAPEQSNHAKDRREPTAQSVIADLQKTGELIASTLEFFKPLSSSLAHASRAAQTTGGPVAPPDLKIHFSEADLDALSKKKPVRVNGHDGKPDSRTLITPQGKFFWGLTQELEEKALELEKHIEELKGAARYHARKQIPSQSTASGLGTQTNSKDILPALATALKEAGAKSAKPAGQPMPKIDPTSALLGSAALPLPPVQAPAELPPPQQAQQQQTPADAGTYLNQFVLPKTDNPHPNTPRPEMAAVGGLPGAGTAQMSMDVNKIAKAAKVVAEGGAVGSELDGMGVMAADLLGGVFVQGLEALVGAGLGLSGGNGEVGHGIDVQGLVNAFEAGGFGGRKGRSVLNVEEAEQAMLAARRDHDALEKKLAGLMKRNRKFVSGR